MIIGVDVGGTFTDFAVIGDNGRLHIHKRLSTPGDPARAVLDGLNDLGAPPGAVIVHGSTIATNALLERKGARTALVATRGFADVIEIGRQNRPSSQLYALEPIKPPPLVPRELRFELDERVTADGSILQPLDPAEVESLVEKLHEAKVESVAVCFLFSFLNSRHEQLVGQAFIDNGRGIAALSETPPKSSIPADAPHAGRSSQSIWISLSSEVLPEYREYERTSATVINAYVAPLMARYLERLESALAGRRLRIMQSNGGVISAATASSQAARTVLSGPAGGLVGAFRAAQQALTSDRPVSRVRSITFDMGGTSTDVALCDGALPTTTEGEIAGLPIRLPILDIHTVGAGGGSIARIDAGGALVVGPESAGADPGPACYGRGGDLPTVTDANLVLGRLDADHFLGGQMRLDNEAAWQTMHMLSSSVLRPSSNAPSLAWGILRVANATMERAIRRISVERGHDPRRFALVAFGGAGPLHACELATSLGIPRVLVPPSPGVLSAQGMAAADTIKDYARAVLSRADDISGDEFDLLFAEMTSRGQEDMKTGGFREGDIVLQRALDLRYAGQSYEITVEENSGLWDKPGFLTRFHELHAARYGHSHPDREVEIVAARVKAIGRARGVGIEPETPGAERPADPFRQKLVWFGDAFVSAFLYHRDALHAGQWLAGPAVIFQFDTTTVVPPGWQARVDRWRNLILELK